MVERTYAVKLTFDEAQALRIASSFGSPDPVPPPLASARSKLLALEQWIADPYTVDEGGEADNDLQ